MFTRVRSRRNDKLMEETTMKKLLAGLVLGGALLVGVPNWFPTEARMAEEPLQVQAIQAAIEDEYLPVDARFAAADDEVLPVDARFAAADDQVLPVNAQLG